MVNSLFSASNQQHRLLWVSLFFIAFLLLGLNVYKDYGVSWDEPISRDNGMISLKYLIEKLAPNLIEQDWMLGNYPALADYKDKDYGVAFELPLALLEKLLLFKDSKDIYYFRHLMTFFMYFAGVFAVFKLVERRFADWRLGLLGALFMVLSPRMFAEGFYNDKDVVFLALFAINLNTMVLFLQRPTIRMAMWHALATAILIDVRIMGIILAAATLVMILLRLGRREVPFRASFASLLTYLALSVFLVIALWPYLWSDPLGNFIQAFNNMANFRWPFAVLYLGEYIKATELPWHYIPVWLIITTPVFYTLLFFIGVFSVLRQVYFRGWKIWHGDNEWQDLLFLGLFSGPILTVILLDSVLYDGWRQMYFIYPLFILLAVRGWLSFFSLQFIKYPQAWPVGIGIVTFLILISTSTWMIRFHPFQYVYFNQLAGKDVKSKFDVDYWGVSSRQALQYILDHDDRSLIKVWPGSFLPLANGKLLLEPKDRKRLVVVNQETEADYNVTQYRNNPNDYSKLSSRNVPFHTIYVDNEEIISVFKRGRVLLNEN